MSENTPEEAVEIQAPDTEIVHAPEVNTENPEGETTGIEVTEDPGSAPDEADQGDPDDNSSDDTENDPEPSDEAVSVDGDA